MKEDGWVRYGAAAGAVAVVLFAVGGLVLGKRPDFGGPAADAAAFFAAHRTRIQVSAAFSAASMPFMVWFLATVASLTRDRGPAASRAGMVAFGCGVSFVALFLADVTTLAVGALRPKNMLAAPELAATLRDTEFLLMGMAAFLGSAVLIAFAVLALRDRVLWPVWLGRLAAIAALAYALRVGTLFTTHGAFAADGLLGLWVPVVALAGWILLGSLLLTLRIQTTSQSS
jgi:hypothetical protein